MSLKRNNQELHVTGFTDEELVELFVTTGQRFYFELLYGRYSMKVYHKCRFFVNDPVKAQDLSHDIFLKLFSKLSGFKKQSKFSTWLYTITNNHCINQLRYEKRRAECMLDGNIDIADGADINRLYDPEHSNELNIAAAMTQLTTDERGLLLMKYTDNLPLVDIADIYNITAGAVKMRLLRAREKLRQKFIERALQMEMDLTRANSCIRI